MGVGVGLTVLRQGLVWSSTALRRRLLVSLEINNKDPAYAWFLHWMSRQTPTGIAKSWTRSHQLSVETLRKQHSNGSWAVDFSLIPGTGSHLLRFGPAWLHVHRERATNAKDLTTGVPWETVTLTTLSRDRNIFPKLLSQARDMAMKGHEGKLVIHAPRGFEWAQFGNARRKRPLKSVVLGDGIAEKIANDVKTFMDRRQWYYDRGIPYRRGYLLHGPPGSGKSSFIQALAGSLSYDISLLNLSERGLQDDKLIMLLSKTPERSFVLIEDIDAVFNKRVQTSEDGYQSSVTFSGFLNALDGVASGEERIIFMTTNHPERLDPALIRPGRVDLSVLIDDATPSQAKVLFTRFYGHDEDTPGWEDIGSQELETMGHLVEKIVTKHMANGRRVSMAALQGLFIRNSSKEAVERLDLLFDERPSYEKNTV
ncbi:BCS1 N terminal-domain-containing protein [Irpex rosettiformis]|uniref:BCS1 N terminal-domain-containing protein n=1 Tax=Irpex rosettiformis TaxID=378272 RepID=A0ACB8UHJ7_9APHY|nr:BCS1 N terminal-domain-containing protein [Irpex rosettiformis]